MISSKVLAIVAFLFPLTIASAEKNPHLCIKNCKLDSRGYKIIQEFEGYSPFVYADVAGVPTIGFGHAVKPGEKFLQPMTGDEAQNLLESDVSATARGINEIVRVPLANNQFDALLSFSYNLGLRTLKRSSVLIYVNKSQPEEVPVRMLRYVNAGGKKIKGLIVRRRAEAELFAEAD